MMPPDPRATIGPSAAWVSRITAVTSTSSMACSASTSLSRKRCLSPKPALLTRSSTGRSASRSRASTVRELRAVDEVGDEDLDGDAVRRAQLLGDPLEAGAVAGDEHQVVAAPGEPVGEGESDAGGRAGDEGVSICGMRGSMPVSRTA